MTEETEVVKKKPGNPNWKKGVPQTHKRPEKDSRSKNSDAADAADAAVWVQFMCAAMKTWDVKSSNEVSRAVVIADAAHEVFLKKFKK